ncbi:DUF1295 domain-containing protein [Streptomyces omiyaensis]|uniref:Uncharacterized protein n=1 Tax=Streptomyces omiyaensis TaxID=68247 RepID=A0ABW7C471_9ACTN|nr:hypothetical protein [Streptomyces omiyaensis]GGY84802.1 hypothetical protein GCM10010363_76340 [Streptomyces omiyaensis]
MNGTDRGALGVHLAAAPAAAPTVLLTAVATVTRLISLPVRAVSSGSAPLDAPAHCGLAVWAAGLAFDAVGGHHPARFKAPPACTGRTSGFLPLSPRARTRPGAGGGGSTP